MTPYSFDVCIYVNETAEAISENRGQAGVPGCDCTSTPPCPFFLAEGQLHVMELLYNSRLQESGPAGGDNLIIVAEGLHCLE